MDFMLKHNAEYEILEESQYTRIRFKIRVIDFERYFNDFTQADVLSKEEAGRILTAAEETLGAKVVSDFSLDRHSLNVRIVKTEKTDLFVSAILNLLQKLYEENEVSDPRQHRNINN
jgi:hypothetical protein